MNLSRRFSQLNTGKSVGPDSIVPSLLKHLSTKGSLVLLTILGSIWIVSWFPQSWRTTYVVPLLKKWKDPEDVGSYRSLALTSTIGNVLEKLIVNRLSWWLEKHSALSPWQAGFRKGRSTTDQCLRLSPFISDGFLSTQRQRTVATFFDFILEYDRVLRIVLVMKMLKMGDPRLYIYIYI